MSFIFLWSLSVGRTKALLALLLTRDLCIHQVILPRYVHSIVKILYKLQKIYSDSIHFVAINQGEYPNFVTVLTLKQWVFKKIFQFEPDTYQYTFYLYDTINKYVYFTF